MLRKTFLNPCLNCHNAVSCVGTAKNFHTSIVWMGTVNWTLISKFPPGAESACSWILAVIPETSDPSSYQEFPTVIVPKIWLAQIFVDPALTGTGPTGAAGFVVGVNAVVISCFLWPYSSSKKAFIGYIYFENIEIFEKKKRSKFVHLCNFLDGALICSEKAACSGLGLSIFIFKIMIFLLRYKLTNNEKIIFQTLS